MAEVVVITPTRGAFRRSVLDWAVGHAALSLLLAVGLYVQSFPTVAFAAVGMAIWTPIMAMSGYRTTRMAYSHRPEKEPRLAVIGLFFFMFVGFLAYAAFTQGRNFHFF